jgi:hypothetical protein
MIEMTLRSMTIRWFWKTITVPNSLCNHELIYHLNLNVEFYSFCNMIPLFVPDFDLRYPLYICSISLPTNTIQLIIIISYPLWFSHFLASGVDMILPCRPIVVSIHHMIVQIPLLTHTPQPITLAYLSATFMTTLLWRSGWWYRSNRMW